MHFLVFDGAPQPFDENIVHETTASVHRNRDACGLEPTGEDGAGELRALIGVEYFWRAVPRQRFVERRDAKPVSIVFDKRHARTARLAQSIIATRYRKPS